MALFLTSKAPLCQLFAQLGEQRSISGISKSRDVGQDATETQQVHAVFLRVLAVRVPIGILDLEPSLSSSERILSRPASGRQTRLIT